MITGIAKGSRKVVKRDTASDYYLFELRTLPYMSRQKFLTVEGPGFGEGELDVVITPPDVTVFSDEEDMDNDLTESKAMLPDAAGEIEIYFTQSEME